MKRDRDVIREVLVAVECLSPDERNRLSCREGDGQDAARVAHALLLRRVGLIEGLDAGSAMGPVVMCPVMTWQRHDRLEPIRSKAGWERIKKIAREKGIELTFDGVKALSKAALTAIIGSWPSWQRPLGDAGAGGCFPGRAELLHGLPSRACGARAGTFKARSRSSR
jgi:hypothetical protein